MLSLDHTVCGFRSTTPLRHAHVLTEGIFQLWAIATHASLMQANSGWFLQYGAYLIGYWGVLLQLPGTARIRTWKVKNDIDNKGILVSPTPEIRTLR